MFRMNYFKMEQAGEPAGGGGTPAPGGKSGNPENFSFPENWKDYLPDDLKNESSLGVIKDIPSLAKSYVHAQKHIGAGKVVKPTEHSTEEDWRKFYHEIGLPEKADDYLKDIPKEKAETEFFKGFKEAAYKAGLLPHQSKKLLEWYDTVVSEHTKQLTDNWNAKIADAEASLKKEWGLAYKDKMAQTQAVVKELNEKLGDNQFVTMLEETGLGNDPRFAKALAAVAEMVGEDKFEGGGRATGALTPSEIQEKIRAYQGDLTGPYYNAQHPNHKAVVEEVYKLYQMLNPKN